MRLTVGPLPPAVYWRRRTIVLGAVLVLLFLVAQACMSAAASPEQDRTAGPASPPPSSPAAAPSGTPPATGPPATSAPTGSTATPTGSHAGGPAGTGSSAPADPDACTDQEMRITAEADQASFPVGASVQFTIRIRNAADRSCRRDIGGDQRELYLRQGTGATKVWSTQDCDPPTGTDVRELAPGFETSHFIVWHGRSSESCQGGQPGGARVEPGEYQLTARLGTAHSEPVTITVTG